MTQWILSGYALGKKSDEPEYLSSLLMKLTEKMARRLRKPSKQHGGVHVACAYIDGSYWHRGRTFDEEMFTTDELYKKVMYLMRNRSGGWLPNSKYTVLIFQMQRPYRNHYSRHRRSEKGECQKRLIP